MALGKRCSEQQGEFWVPTDKLGGGPSALSIFDFRVKRLEFVSCVVDGELPVDAAFLGVAGSGPGLGFFAELLDIADATAL